MPNDEDERAEEKQPDDEDPAEHGDASEEDASREHDGRADPQKKDASSRRLPWGWLLLAAGLGELYAFGARAEIEVCVAQDGVHDFALLGQPRTDENRRRYPSCETRLNLGVLGDFTKREQEAMYLACRRATRLGNKRDTAVCAAKIGWSHRSRSQQIWPWDRRFYRQLFWFLFS